MNNLKTRATGHDVQFMGTFPKESMASVLQDIDVLVIPSRWYENSPLVLLNALATHTPVLVANVSGMTEFIDEGVNGRVFERGSVNDLFIQLEDMIAYPEKNLYSLAKTTSFQRGISDMAIETLKLYSC
jgi:glycosyltransferase involved in cell wall biosynthesis